MDTSSFQPISYSRRIIIVENDHELGDGLMKFLGIFGYEVLAVGSALEFYRAIEQYDCCLAIIDVGLPDQNGLLLVEYLRNNSDMYILMLISKQMIDDKLTCYRAGADMLLEKPVDFRELSAILGNIFDRIGSPERAAQPQANHPAKTPEGVSWKIMRDGWALISPKGESISLTLKEFKFLLSLSNTSAMAVSRKELLKTLEYQNDEYGHRALESLVHRLRNKTATLGSSPIKTAHGVGYSFTAPVNIV